MRYPTRFLVTLFILFLVAGCSSSDDGATDETTAAAATTTTAAPTTTMTPTTTTAASTTTAATTTTAPVQELPVDDEMGPAFAVAVRTIWERAERTVGGTAPDISDAEIIAIGTDICDYIGAHPLPAHSAITAEQRMEIFTEVATLVCEAIGIPYDPALQDAGFESQFEARIVMGFRDTLNTESLCPPPSSGPGAMPCTHMGCILFASPWSAAASAQ